MDQANVNHLHMADPPREGEIIIGLKKCPRCGGDHRRMRFRGLTMPNDRWSEWGPCPATVDFGKLVAAATDFLKRAAAAEDKSSLEQAAIDLAFAACEPVLLFLGGGHHATSAKPEVVPAAEGSRDEAGGAVGRRAAEPNPASPAAGE